MDTKTIGLTWLAAGGMTLALAVATCLVVRQRFPSPWTDYLLGAAAWAASVAMKVAGAVVLFAVLAAAWGGTPQRIPWLVVLLATGLLTGVFECGMTYAVVRSTRLGTPRPRPGEPDGEVAGAGTWNSGVAFGVAFGCFEAAVLAVLALVRGLVALTWDLLPPEAEGAAIAREITAPGGPSPWLLILERAISVPVHALACLLIVAAVRLRRPALFWWSFLLKTAIDAVPTGAELPESGRQAIYILFGAFSLWALRRLLRGLSSRERGGPRGRGDTAGSGPHGPGGDVTALRGPTRPSDRGDPETAA